MVRTTVASANVRDGLCRREAEEAVRRVLAHDPDLVGLQEWYPQRRGLLPRAAFRWHQPWVGGCAVGVRRDRYADLRFRSVVLSRPGRADRRGSWIDPEPGRVATVLTCQDRELRRPVTLIDFHLVSGVQQGDAYRADRPRLVRRHHAEVDRLRRVVETHLARGEVVHAVGDSNLHGLLLPGLTSAWSSDDDRGTLGPRRQVDDVLGPGAPSSVTLVPTASDHLALVVSRDHTS